ncbi:winged helix-turn-helix domain-containing protein [Amycolatopsis pigmentata]|uniref:Winged helix-turn-helix domain-containing protein n=1 Tax=Amycolatopsis pigmentata TaxID=450801 RepID=A0ABW5G5B7_9PSEU
MSFKIETSTPAYIYETMADHIEARIMSGELRPGDPLPAERKLAEDYEVSLGTARRATEALRHRGLVVTLRSKGTFVVDANRRDHSGVNATVHHITPDRGELHG